MILYGMLLKDPKAAISPGWVAIEDGRISEMGTGLPPEKPRVSGQDMIICPAFVDAHIHLPQISAIGCDTGDLLGWLDRVIYPAEARWGSIENAADEIRIAYERMIEAGTLSYGGYLTGHPHGVDALMERHAEQPLRAIAGLSLSDRETPPPLLNRECGALSDGDDRLSFSINPRFAVACSRELLAAAGAQADDGKWVQTHLSESRVECELVGKLFPEDLNYTSVYDRHRLLKQRTLLAHCLHLCDSEWALIAQRGSTVVHCPTANTFLASGLFNLDAAREHGVRLALGSDVAAGPDIAMPRVARAMIEMAKSRYMTNAPGAHIPSPAEAWRQITQGNAAALGFEDGGKLEIGAAADLLVLRPPFPIDEHLIGRLIYTWRDDYIAHRILAGQILE